MDQQAAWSTNRLRGHDNEIRTFGRRVLVRDALTKERLLLGPSNTNLSAFNPFNLVVADQHQAVFVSNRPELNRSVLAPGIHGLSNGSLNEPWPKTLRLKQMFEESLFRCSFDPRMLLDDLGDEILPDVDERSTAPSEVTQEPPMSPIFIRNPVYGTRCSTVVAIDKHSQGTIIERRYTPADDNCGETALTFCWKT